MPPLQRSPESPVEPSDRKAGRAMAFSLKCLLDRVPGAREVLAHLAALERGLAADGPDVLDQVPLPALKKMGAQLASLPVRPQDLPLRALQVRLLHSIERRSAPPPPPPSFLPSDLDPGKVEVSEVSESDWAEASQLFEDSPGLGLQPR
jgi:hypothetical protein